MGVTKDVGMTVSVDVGVRVKGCRAGIVGDCGRVEKGMNDIVR